MSGSINNYANSGYYQLSSFTGGASGGSTGSTGTTNATQSLLNALSGGSGSGSSSSDDAYLLNLSPEAQQYLATGTSSSASTTSLASLLGLGSSSASSIDGSSSFTLTPQQQQTLNGILETYKNSPVDQTTFNEIQSALQKAGLDTTTLSDEDQAKSFSPTLLLVNDLNGGSSSGISGEDSSADEQTKSQNYMANIVSEWKSMDTSSSASGTSAAAVTPVSTGGEA